DRGQERPAQPEECEAIRYEIGLRVTHRDAEEYGAEHRDANGVERRPKRENGAQPSERHHELDDEVRGRYRLGAATTASAQNEPAHNRHILDPGELMPALRASRAGTYHRLLARPSSDANVEEGADAGSEDEREEWDQFRSDADHDRSS